MIGLSNNLFVSLLKQVSINKLGSRDLHCTHIAPVGFATKVIVFTKITPTLRITFYQTLDDLNHYRLHFTTPTASFKR